MLPINKLPSSTNAGCAVLDSEHTSTQLKRAEAPDSVSGRDWDPPEGLGAGVWGQRGSLGHQPLQEGSELLNRAGSDSCGVSGAILRQLLQQVGQPLDALHLQNTAPF